MKTAFHLVHNGGLQIEGIFRVPAPNSDIGALKDAFDLGGNFDLNKYDFHVVACAFKTFFRDMPDPIFTYDSYAELMKNPKGNL